jgi:hypothetical protein
MSQEINILTETNSEAVSAISDVISNAIKLGTSGNFVLNVTTNTISTTFSMLVDKQLGEASYAKIEFSNLSGCAASLWTQYLAKPALADLATLLRTGALASDVTESK